MPPDEPMHSSDRERLTKLEALMGQAVDAINRLNEDIRTLVTNRQPSLQNVLTLFIGAAGIVLFISEAGLKPMNERYYHLEQATLSAAEERNETEIRLREAEKNTIRNQVTLEWIQRLLKEELP